LLIPLVAAIAPFILWPLELFLPYPFLIEEIVKTGIVYFVLKEKGEKTKLFLTIMSGVLFSITETVLYSFNIFIAGTKNTLLQRFSLTTPLHVGTILIIFLLANKNKNLLFLGTAVAITIHFVFNKVV